MMMPWKRNLQSPSKPASAPVEPLTAQALIWLLAALVLAVAPHARELPIWLIALFAGVSGWRGYIVIRNRSLPPRWALLILAVAAGAGVLLEYRTLLGRDAGVALLTAMTACKLMETRSLRDGVVVVLLGYLLVMSTLLYSQDIPMVAYLLIVIVVMLAAQVLIHRQHSGLSTPTLLRMSGRMVLLAIPTMLILFVLFPRIPGPLWGLPKDAHEGRTGLSEEMAPGTISALSKSSEVAFRVRFTSAAPPPNQRYWRGPVLWNFNGRRWTALEELGSQQALAFTPEGPAVDYSVMLEPSNRRWLLALDLPASLPPRSGMTSSFQLLRDQPVNEVYRYEVRSYPTYRTGELTPQERIRGLQLPSRSNPQSRALVAEWRQRDPRPEALVNAALTLFREQEFYYTLTPPLLGDSNIIDGFLFRTRQGFCEHYASAFVFLMRVGGVPARVITGYQGGERNDLGNYYIVRQADAHAWAEVWLEGRGWVRIDPTAAVAPNRIQDGGLFASIADPQALPFLMRRGGDSEWLRQLALSWDSFNNIWNEWVVAYGPDRQKEFLSGLGFGPVDWGDMTVAMISALSGLGLAYAGLRWRQRYARDPVVRAWQRFCARLARRGLAREADEGPLAFAERVAHQRPDLAESVWAISRLYAMLRYGPIHLPSAVRQLQQSVQRFRA